MPTTYAHYTYASEVLKNTNEELRDVISQNIDLFNIGLHGPDLLFYYKALKSNKVNKYGSQLHGLSASIFFENAREKLLACSDYKKAFSYIAGFICHFILDSQCHPYIGLMEGQISHNEIETEFDRYIMLRHKLDPMTFKPTSHLVPSRENSKYIAMFFKDITEEEIYRAWKSMKFYLNFLSTSSPLLRSIIINALKISGNTNKIDLIKKEIANEKCNETNEKLIALYEEAIMPAALLIEEYYYNISNANKEKLNKRFNRNFGWRLWLMLH